MMLNEFLENEKIFFVVLLRSFYILKWKSLKSESEYILMKRNVFHC